ncbi:MAG: YitT family protein [Clostridia bacterium]|nr:YitT family protein [Clostridia bacterium]
MKNIFKDYFVPFIMITLGAFMAAFSLENFLVPNTVLDGGITGISIILNQLTGYSMSIFIVIINLPFMFIGFRHLGLRFLVSGIYSMAVFTLFIQVFEHMANATSSELLAVVFGGVILGLGVGLVLKFGGCLDGTEIIAMLVSKKSGFSTGQIIFVINIVIYAVAGFLFGWDRAMYSLLTYFISFKMIDIIEEGLEQAKAAMIITDNAQNISETIYNRLGRTCTIIKGEGLISGTKTVLYCVVTRLEVGELKRIIKEYDGSAFVTISDVSEIIGTHIKQTGK